MSSTIIKEGKTRTYKRRTSIGAIVCLAMLLVSPSLLRAQTNNALDFDGTEDYVQLPAGRYFRHNNFTIEAWVYPKSFNLWSRVIDFSNGPSSDNVLLALTDGTGGKPTGSIFNNSDGTNFGADNPLPLHTWSHLAITVSGTDARIYINGALEKSFVDINLVNDVERALCYVGKSAWDDGMANMILDELKIWNSALTEADLANNMNKKPAADQPGLVVYFDFDQGVDGGNNTSITSVIDRSGNGNHGTFRNFTLDGGISNFVQGVTISGVGSYTLTPSITTPTTISKNLLDEAFTLTATSISPAPFTYSVQSGTSITLDGATVSIAGKGTSVVRISQAAVPGFVATHVDVTITVITLPAVLDPSEAHQPGVGSYPMSIANDDFNGDGFADLAVAFNNSNNVVVYMNDGRGAFSPSVSYRVGVAPTDISVGDLNGDGKPDLVTANSASSSVSVLMNTGTGTFEAQVPYQVGNYPRGVTLGDLDGDGKLDLAVSNTDDYTVSILINQGDGTFATQVTYDVGPYPKAIVTGDINGDGKLDLATTSDQYYEFSVLLLNTGTGTFYPHLLDDGGLESNDLTIGDLDGDGKLDLAAANISHNKITVLIGNGSGGFAAPVSYTAGTLVYSLAIADLNKDGKLDLAATNSDKVSILMNTGGAFDAPVTYPSEGSTHALTIGDWNADKQPDVAAVSLNNKLSIFLNTGGGVLGEATNITTYFGFTSLAAGDLNGDSKDDLVIGTTERTILVRMNLGNNNYAPPVKYETGVEPYIVIADLNGDGKSDVATATDGDHSVYVFINTGDGTLSAPTVYNVGGDPGSIVAGDLNGDGKLDLITANSSDESVSVLINTGNGTFNPEVRYEVGRFPMGVVTGDLDGDGKLDLVTSNNNDNNVSVLINSGTGTFNTQITYGVGGRPNGLDIGDLNADGKLDLAVANAQDQTVSVLINTGTGTFDTHVPYGANSNINPVRIAIADLNGDSNADLIVANNTEDFLTVLNNTGDGFETGVHYPVELNGLRNVVIANLDDDGRPDLAGIGYVEFFALLNKTITKSQTISFAALNDKTYGDAVFDLTATASSNLPVVYASSNTNVATVDGNRVTIVGAGTTTITASQPGREFYGSATAVEQSLTVHKANQAITFAPLTNKTFGNASFTLTATGGKSGNAVTYTSSNTAVATVSGSTVTIVGVGNTSITASQAGNENYNAATSVEQNLTVNKANQTITFTALENKTIGHASFDLTATSSSSLAVAYTSNDKVTISGSQVTLTQAGRATIAAAQAGNANYAAATSVEQSFCINPAKPIITEDFTNPETPVFTSSAASGNQWYKNGELISGATGNTYTVTAPGAYTVIVTVEGCVSESSAGAGVAITGLEGASSSVISIYPNPAHQQIEIHFSKTGEKQLEIISVHGHVIHQAVVSSEKTSVSVGDYTPGVYIVKARTANQTYRTRFIKK